LIALSGDQASIRNTEAVLTPFGIEVLKGTTSNYPANPIEDWAAGVKLSSEQGALWFNDGGKSRGTSFSPYVNIHPSSSLQLSIGPGITRDHPNTQWFGNFTDSATGITHYTFAHLDQRTVSMSTRLNYTVTPNLTFEFYGQPFVSTGKYSSFREVSDTPDADRYADRFVPYTPPPSAKTAFKVTQLRTNTVVRWEYRPGSTLFVVWTQGRQDDENRNPDQSWAEDYRDLFALHPDNTFLVKLVYWFSR